MDNGIIDWNPKDFAKTEVDYLRIRREMLENLIELAERKKENYRKVSIIISPEENRVRNCLGVWRDELEALKILGEK